ncbi:hypothetical protein VP01_238g11 [Puccinia sorghi]|uniref:Uncharacterized protein n=1 Tax=Puccinia sorghi TaxID=27349 RepID=A0A0L6V710_9BASI|nr:hypothetical protein VP01_238g11 [Puccinia sorghi]
MQFLHQVPFVVLFLSAIAWCNPVLHLEPAHTSPIHARDFAVIPENWITSTLQKRESSPSPREPGKKGDNSAAKDQEKTVKLQQKIEKQKEKIEAAEKKLKKEKEKLEHLKQVCLPLSFCLTSVIKSQVKGNPDPSKAKENSPVEIPNSKK